MPEKTCNWDTAWEPTMELWCLVDSRILLLLLWSPTLLPLRYFKILYLTLWSNILVLLAVSLYLFFIFYNFLTSGKFGIYPFNIFIWELWRWISSIKSIHGVLLNFKGTPNWPLIAEIIILFWILKGLHNSIFYFFYRLVL